MERIPILRVGEFLLVTIQVDMHDQLAMQLQEDLTTAIQKRSAKGVLIDISALEMVRLRLSWADALRRPERWERTCGRAHGAGQQQPAVADHSTLVELGLSLPGVATALDVDRGLALLRKVVAEE